VTEKELNMSGTATLTYDLSKPEQVMAHKYALKGLEACQLLESLKGLTAGYTAYKGVSESVLANIIADLSKWEDVKL
jgi:midasin (ATPase involved in ribosome maturation)